MRQQLDTTQPWELSREQQPLLQLDIMPAYQRQVERSAKEVSIQRTAEDIVGAILRYNQSTEGKQAAQPTHYRNPAYNSSPMIYRNAPHLRTVAERLRCGCSECRTLLGEYGQGYKRFR